MGEALSIHASKKSVRPTVNKELHSRTTQPQRLGRYSDRSLSQYSHFCVAERYRPRLIPFAAVQIYVEHASIIAQIDLKVAIQAGVRLYHGFNGGKVALYPEA